MEGMCRINLLAALVNANRGVALVVRCGASLGKESPEPQTVNAFQFVLEAYRDRLILRQGPYEVRRISIGDGEKDDLVASGQRIASPMIVTRIESQHVPPKRQLHRSRGG